MMFYKQKTIILSFVIIFSLVQLINSADPEVAVPTDSTKTDSTKTDSVGNDGANKPADPAKIEQPTPVNIATTPTATQQSSTTQNQNSIFCKMICMPLHACKTFFGDTFKIIWKNILKAKDKIISVYKPSTITVNNVG
ncbi:uncharacterized protein LOC113549567 [Rhopalosiphum maidis]|uniref:uncharacterized protein LOC113549567 n=1 Tax=Rhopalosiphum maidis TaxID=43146 RepID=UPI000EFF7DB6|nr:uncharacterized protein LOC113549567 [Rhopalosiphum maidis]